MSKNLTLFIFGLFLRLALIPFAPMHDANEQVRKFGGCVLEAGHVGSGWKLCGYQDYGGASYALHGIAAYFGQSLTDWWMPHKLIVLIFEVIILLALWQLVPGKRLLVTVAYWLNPLFIVHGALFGFWDATHTALILLALLAFERVEVERFKWLALGALLMCAALFKPQGLYYFLLPIGAYVAWLRRPLPYFAAGVLAVFVSAMVILKLDGSGWDGMVYNYGSVLRDHGLCSGCVGLWRPLAAMQASGQPVWSVPSMGLADLIGRVLAFGMLAVVGYRAKSLLPVMVACGLLLPVFLTHTHENHAYAGLVLLCVLALREAGYLKLYAGLTGLLWLVIVGTYGLAGHRALPDNAVWLAGLSVAFTLGTVAVWWSMTGLRPILEIWRDSAFIYSRRTDHASGKTARL